MALGGGTFVAQNKVLAGAYINFVSASSADASLSDRGIVTMPLSLKWGKSGVFEVTKADFVKNCFTIFGYEYTDDQMKNLRELFQYATKLYAYRLNGGGVKATCTYADAKYAGTRGNDLKIVVATNVEDATKMDVSTYLGSTKVDTQTVSSAASLVSNDFVDFKTSATLVVSAGTPLTGGTDSEVSGTNYSNYITAIEPYTFNVMGVDVTDATTLTLFATYIQTRRDTYGKKCQLVLYNKAADYEGVINIKNTVSDSGASAASLVYFTAGLEASCEVNKSCSNAKYTGEYTISADYSQSQLETFIGQGCFVYHKVGTDLRVLSDINSLVTTTTTKGDLFKKNQTIRVIDQIANDVASTFADKYLGEIPNDADGRISLWNDLVKLHEELQVRRAIEDFDSEDITVERGDSADSVVVNDAITIVNAMEKLYMTVTVA